MDKPQSGFSKFMGTRAGKWTLGAIVLSVFGIIGAMSGPDSSTTPSTESTSQVTTNTSTRLNVGDQGVLRAGTSDPIFLAVDEAAFNELGKALSANDTAGVLELAAKGKVFGVSAGSSVLVTDRDTFTREVRILSGSKEIDADKVGKTGWVPFEWVVKE